MVKKAVPILVALLVGWFAHAIFGARQDTYNIAGAAEICHQALQDKWQETADLEFTDEWKTDSRATNVPGWSIMGGAFADRKEGTTRHLLYHCIIVRRELRMASFGKIDPPKDRD